MIGMDAGNGPRIGFGCASLGSRISARDGLAALERAYEAGVRWFDVAPSYGDGEAEMLLGQFLREHRGGVTVATKVGILPGRLSLPKRLLKPAVRMALSVAPALRSAVKKRRPAAQKPPLTAAMITQSIDGSLSRLGVERVDVLSLHEATPAEVEREDVLRAVETVLAQGKAARIGIASTPAAAEAGLAASSLYGLVQIANNPLEPGLAEVTPFLPADRQVETVTHSVFGASGLIQAVEARIAAKPELAGALAEAGYSGGPRQQALAFLPDYAFATNRRGVVLLSMFSREHLEANLARHARPRDPAAIGAIATMLAHP